jgi:hypothetical protein
MHLAGLRAPSPRHTRDLRPLATHGRSIFVKSSRCSRHVRFVPIASQPQRSDGERHVWTAPGWQGFSSRWRAGRCSHVFGLLAQHTSPLAIMPSADQVPVKSSHSTIDWHLWVVLIAGSTGSALRAVRPPNLHITPDVGAISVTPQVRRVPCSDHPRAIMAHAILAILLASAIAATFVGRRASNAVSHGRCLVPWIPLRPAFAQTVVDYCQRYRR